MFVENEMCPPQYVSSDNGNTSMYFLPITGSTTANVKAVD